MNTKIRRTLLTAVAASLLLLGQPFEAHAAGGPYPPNCVVTVAPVNPDAGGVFTVTATDSEQLNEGNTFIFWFEGEPDPAKATKEKVLTNGQASASFKAPFAPGNYDGTVVMAPDIPCGAFVVTIPEEEGLPPTGSNAPSKGLLIGAGLLGLGGVMVLVAYRRRHHHQAAAAA